MTEEELQANLYMWLTLYREGLRQWSADLAYSEAILYSQTRNVEAIRRLFKVNHNRTTSVEPQPAIFPGWNGSVIRKTADGERELVTMN